MRGDGGVAGEGRIVGVPKFHSWGKCTICRTYSVCLLRQSSKFIYLIRPIWAYRIQQQTESNMHTQM